MENLCKLCAGTLPQPQQEQHLITTITSPSGGKHNKCKCTNENECSSQMSETTLTLDRDPVVAVPLNPTLVGLIKEIFPFCVSSVKVNPNREGQTVGAQDFENDGDGIEPKTPFHLKEPSICSYCHQLLYQTIEFFGKVRSGQRALTSLKSAANHKKRGRPKKLMSQQSPIEPISDSPLVNPSSRPKRTIHPPPRYGSPLLSSEEQDPSQHQKPDSNSEPQQNQLNPEPTYNLMSILGPVPPLQPQLDVIMEGDEEVDTVVAPPVSVVESEDSDKDQYENEPEDEFVPGKRSQSQARRRQQKPKKRRHKTLASASPVICQVCNVRLKFKSSLIQHMRNHESTSSGDPNILPHACSYCSKRFNHRGNLASHERSHIGSRPYSCKVDGCGRAFVTNSQLKKHTNLVHLGLKLWLCPICGQTFGQKDGLVRHTNLRHSEKEPEVDGSLIPDENTNSISNNGQVVYVLHEIQDFELNELSTVTVT